MPKKTTVYIEEDQLKQTKIYCANHNISFKKFIKLAIENMLKLK